MNHYYIGSTSNSDIDISQLYNHNNWIYKYKPIEIIKIITNCNKYDEDKYTLMYMDKYGIDNVRGGSFSNIILTDIEVQIIQKMISNTNKKIVNNNDNIEVDIIKEQFNKFKNKKQYNIYMKKEGNIYRPVFQEIGKPFNQLRMNTINIIVGDDRLKGGEEQQLKGRDEQIKHQSFIDYRDRRNEQIKHQSIIDKIKYHFKSLMNLELAYTGSIDIAYYDITNINQDRKVLIIKEFSNALNNRQSTINNVLINKYEKWAIDKIYDRYDIYVVNNKVGSATLLSVNGFRDHPMYSYMVVDIMKQGFDKVFTNDDYDIYIRYGHRLGDHYFTRTEKEELRDEISKL
jgi:hypothetical protein